MRRAQLWLLYWLYELPKADHLAALSTATRPIAARNIVLALSERKFNDASDAGVQQNQNAPQNGQNLPENAKA